MSENKTARTSADGPEYERGFVDGMQRQMQLHVNRVIREEPTAWRCQCGKAYTVACVSSKPAKQEPVAFCTYPKCQTTAGCAGVCARQNTTPQPRQWVGLTDEEIDYQAKKDDHAVYFALGALWAEAKLKEKNHG